MAAPLYIASVPVFLHYLERARGIVAKTKGKEDVLGQKLAPDMFSGAQQFASAAGFALRGTYPLIGMSIPEFPSAAMDRDGILARIDFAHERLVTLDPGAFDRAEEQRVRHLAGFADLDQAAGDYLRFFALPNFMFHLSMGFAVLRAGGIDIGKSDFDGLHDYPPGFRF
ncbi:DUF1993 family protein [Maritimibacter sp. DP1N21-5]|uniref:DUF1993 family protein n=1 Tax=Maritimibacter sp. DP1N21-5 TaxID=2836867 RepID=UPI001C46E931|nr:DUF1993 family protein [Maritimibacter sp. DP1N21-5]MBV7408045.1 DUF1993 domain-containing protein [Maritimibacter sp. DP1N21-5]